MSKFVPERFKRRTMTSQARRDARKQEAETHPILAYLAREAAGTALPSTWRRKKGRRK